MLKLKGTCEQMIGQCRDMVATISGVYHKGSDVIVDASKKAQIHLDKTTEEAKRTVNAQAQYLTKTYEKLRMPLLLRMIAIAILSAVTGAVTAGWVTSRYIPQQAEEAVDQVLNRLSENSQKIKLWNYSLSKMSPQERDAYIRTLESQMTMEQETSEKTSNSRKK